MTTSEPLSTRVVLHGPNGVTETINGDHYPIVGQGCFVFGDSGEKSVQIWVRGCSHGSVVVHSDLDRSEVIAFDADEPRIRQAISAVLPALYGGERANLAAVDVILASCRDYLQKLPQLRAATTETAATMAQRLLSAFLPRIEPPPVPLLQNACIETPDIEGDLVIVMTDRNPARIQVEKWPIVAEVFFGYENRYCMSVRVRRRLQEYLIYSELRVLDGSEGLNRRQGFLLNGNLNGGLDQNRQMIEYLTRCCHHGNLEPGRGEWLKQTLLAQMPPDRL